MNPGQTRMLDWRGTEVKVGDTVVYAVRHSSSMWYVEGVVRELHSLIEDRWDFQVKGYLPTQVGGATVERWFEGGQQPTQAVTPKRVKVRLDNLIVVPGRGAS